MRERRQSGLAGVTRHFVLGAHAKTRAGVECVWWETASCVRGRLRYVVNRMGHTVLLEDIPAGGCRIIMNLRDKGDGDIEEPAVAWAGEGCTR